MAYINSKRIIFHGGWVEKRLLKFVANTQLIDFCREKMPKADYDALGEIMELEFKRCINYWRGIPSDNEIKMLKNLGGESDPFSDFPINKI